MPWKTSDETNSVRLASSRWSGHVPFVRIFRRRLEAPSCRIVSYFFRFGFCLYHSGALVLVHRSVAGSQHVVMIAGINRLLGELDASGARTGRQVRTIRACLSFPQCPLAAGCFEI